MRLKFPLQEAAALEQEVKGLTLTAESLQNLGIPLDQYGPFLVPKIESTQRALMALSEAIAA